MKKIISLTIFMCICVLLSGCVEECNDTKLAGINGMILKDTNNRQWLAKHFEGDAYFLYEVKYGKVNFECR